MAQQQINIGASANDGTGDTIRSAFDKVNQNFTEVYGNIDTANSVEADTSPQLGGDLNVGNFSIVSNTGAGIVNIVPSSGGYLRLDGVTVDGTVVSTLANNTNLTLEPQGSGKVISNKIAFTGGTLDNVTIGGITPATGTFDVLTVNNALQATGGSINDVVIGDTTPAAGEFTILTASEIRPDLIVSRGHIVPNTDISHDLGTTSAKWRTLYVNSVNANNINLTGSVSGTFTGNLTGDVTGNLTGNTAGTHTGPVVGNVTGNLTGNSAGTHTGPVVGDVTGNVTGNTAGTHTGPVVGNVTGNLTGNVTGNVTGSLFGNADTATVLATARNINGVSFDGSSNITITANTTNALTFGTGLVSDTFNGSAAKTVEVDTSVIATKAFVNSEIAAVVDGAPAALNTLNELAAALGDDSNYAATIVSALAAKLDLAGGTMTGALTLAGAPVNSLEAATKGYVDSQISSSVSAATTIGSDDSKVEVVDTGSADGAVIVTVDGNLIATFGPANMNMNSKRIVSLADPSGNQDAATKKYVDDEINALATVAATGNYSDLIGAPVLASVATTGNYTDLSNKPALAQVATSGSWFDIADRPDVSNFVANSIYSATTIQAGTSILAPAVGATTSLYVGNLSSSSTSLVEISSLGLQQLRNANLAITSVGNVIIQGLTYPKVDGTNGQALVTNGSGVLSFASLPAAFSGDYNDLSNKPTIPADVSDLTDTTNLLFSGAYADLTGAPILATVATSGDYNDLTNTPTIPAGLLDLGIIDGTNGQVLTTDGAGNFSFTTVSGGGGFSGAYADLTGAPTLATVATSGDYNDLINKPTIPADVSDLTDTGGLLGGGTTLPADASGYLNNDGTGTLTWVPGNPAGSGLLPYSDVKVLSATTASDWTAYSLTGTMEALWDYNNTYGTITLSSEAVYGKQAVANTKVLNVNDAGIDSNTYGLVVEFPASPSVGDVFSVLVQSDTTDVNAGSFVVGQTYVIKTLGTTNWTSIGASFAGVGQTFVATGAGSGTGVAFTAAGVKKIIFKPATGQRVRTMNQGANNLPFYFGQGGSYDMVFLDVLSQSAGNPITWVYAGVIGGTPTWYQSYF